MKIGNGSAGGEAGAAALLDQMTRAHQQAGADVSGALSSPAPTVPDGVDAMQTAQAAQPAGEAAGADALQVQMLEIAQRALHGQILDDRALRAEVIQAIVVQRFSHLLPAPQLSEITQTLCGALVADPSFCAEIDRALVLAARRLARSG